MNNTLKVIFATLAVLPLGVAGCNSAQGGAGIGAGVGALAGQAIGRNTSSTLIGAGAGAAAGYMIGNEMDKQSTQQQQDQMQQEIDQNRYENERRAEAQRQADAQRLRQQENDRRDGGDASQWNSEPGFDSGGGGSQPTSSSSWEFVGEGNNREDARRQARGQARRAIADRTDFWADRSLAAARREFNLRNPAQFQNHFNLVSDAMLQAAQMDSTERRESDRVIFTVRVNLRALRTQFREYLEEADRYVNPSERQAYRQWCDDLTLGA